MAVLVTMIIRKHENVKVFLLNTFISNYLMLQSYFFGIYFGVINQNSYSAFRQAYSEFLE